MPVSITFTITQGGVTRTETLTQDVIKIGKLESSHLRIDDEGVSRMHSVIEVSSPTDVHIIDLGSASGTIVNGHKVNKTKLESGDQLQFGNTLVTIEVGQIAAAVSQPPVAAQVPAAAAPSVAAVMPAAAAAVPNPFGQGAADPGANPFAAPGAVPGMPVPGVPAPGVPMPGAVPTPAVAAPQAAPMAHGGGHGGHGHGDDDGGNYVYQLVATEPPINPADVDSTESAVEVVVMWGELSILHVAHLSPPRGFYVGEATDAKGKPDTDFLIGSQSIGADKMPVTVESGAGVAVVIPQGATGDVTVNEQLVTFEELAAQNQLQACSELAGAMQYPLPPGATARVHHRGFTFVVRPMAAAQKVGMVGRGFDWRSHIWTLASFGFFIAMLILFYFLPPSSASLSLDLLNSDNRLAKYLIEAEETIEEETPEWLEDSKDDDEGGKGKRHKDEEGAMGDKNEKKTKNKFGIEGPQDNEDPQMAREEAKEMAMNAGIIGVLKASVGAFNSPTSPYGADTAVGNDPMSALGALMGDQIGGNFGFGGLGLRGTGRGGGGTGEGTIGLGNIGTIGHGAGGGTGSGYGSGAGGFRGRSARVPKIRTGQADVRGSLSKEVIRRIIRRHINEVRFCYEQELNQRPDLRGRVAVKFIVSPSGAVQMAAVASSTMGNARVEQCIAKAVRRWTFPSPDGGGIVVVTYPFVLEQTGG